MVFSSGFKDELLGISWNNLLRVQARGYSNGYNHGEGKPRSWDLGPLELWQRVSTSNWNCTSK